MPGGGARSIATWIVVIDDVVMGTGKPDSPGLTVVLAQIQLAKYYFNKTLINQLYYEK